MRLKEGLESNRFLIASGTYILASLTDLISTHYGISTNQIYEINPIINEAMNNLGTFPGLALSKLTFTGIILSSSHYINKRYNEEKTKIKSEPFLYSGAILTGLAGLSWILDKYLLINN